jgi:hypothetical protein
MLQNGILFRVIRYQNGILFIVIRNFHVVKEAKYNEVSRFFK